MRPYRWFQEGKLWFHLVHDGGGYDDPAWKAGYRGSWITIARLQARNYPDRWQGDRVRWIAWIDGQILDGYGKQDCQYFYRRRHAIEDACHRIDGMLELRNG